MKKKANRLIILFIILTLIIGVLSYLRLLDTYELALLDLRFKARPLQKIDPQLVIIEISNDTLANIRRWPLPRDYHATLIKVLSDCGAKAVIFDVLFNEPTEQDALLVQATEEAGNVYYPYALELTEIKEDIWQAKELDTDILPSLKKVAKGSGHANVLADRDGKRRRIPLFIEYQGRLLPQLSLKVASDYLKIEPEGIKLVPKRFVQLGNFCRIPVDQQAATLINLAGRWKDTFTHYSYYDVLIAYSQHKAGLSTPGLLPALKDKVCFVGLTATGTADLNPSALEPIYPNLGLQANLFNSIVNKNFLRRLSPLGNLAILYLLCLLSVLLTLKTRPVKGLFYQLGLLFIFTGTGFLLFILNGLWIDLFLPLIVCVTVYLGTNIFRYLKELRNRELLEKELSIAWNIQRSFLRDLPKELSGADIAVEMITARHVGGDLYDFVQFDNGSIGLMVGDVSGKGVPAALFMAQVISQFRNFTSLSSSPAQVLSKLNQNISKEAKSGLFVTMSYLVYNPAKKQLSLASAGHLPVLVFRESQLLAKLDVREGMPIGLIAEAEFGQREFDLKKGDIALLYTDGVTEARNVKAAEFGEENVIQCIRYEQDLSSQEAIRALKQALNSFVGRAKQHDDITVMALKVV